MKENSGPKKEPGEMEAPKLPKSYQIHHETKNGNTECKTFILNKLFQYEFDAINKFLKEIKIEDNWEIEEVGVLTVNFNLSKTQFYPHILSVILRDEKGNKEKPAYFSKCFNEDNQAPINDFFAGEGAFIIPGISSTMLSLLQKRRLEKSLTI